MPFLLKRKEEKMKEILNNLGEVIAVILLPISAVWMGFIIDIIIHGLKGW